MTRKGSKKYPVTLTVQLSTEIAGRLRDLAALQDRPVGSLARLIIRQYLDDMGARPVREKIVTQAPPTAPEEMLDRRLERMVE